MDPIIAVYNIKLTVRSASVENVGLTNEQVAQAIQLGIEYDPQPPFEGGSTAKTPPEIVELVRAHAKQLA